MRQKAEAIYSQLVEWRRELHRHPELQFDLFWTADFIAARLHEFGAQVRTSVGKTGVIAEFGAGEPMVAIRADMDALPIKEETGLPYTSEIDGQMHACGHDMHMAIALGAAKLVSELDLPGRVRFIFQPLEEGVDEEGLGGAQRMLADGALAGISAIFALHVHPQLAVGQIGIRSGVFTTMEDSFYATIVGKGGHGAQPQNGVDPIFLTTQALNSLYAIPSRRVAPSAAAVLSVGFVHGGEARNVIPNEVKIGGTMRSYSTETRDKLRQELQRGLEVVRTLGGDYQWRISEEAPAVVNDAELTAMVEEIGADLLGVENVISVEAQTWSEDFSYFTAEKPGVMFLLGVGGDSPLHNPRFAPDERALPIGAALMAELSLRYLNQNR